MSFNIYFLNNHISNINYYYFCYRCSLFVLFLWINQKREATNYEIKRGQHKVISEYKREMVLVRVIIVDSIFKYLYSPKLSIRALNGWKILFARYNHRLHIHTHQVFSDFINIQICGIWFYIKEQNRKRKC